jgi:hypothetical protein
VASKEIKLEINTDKTKYMVMSRGQNTRRGSDMNIDNSSFERVEEFKYLGTNLTYQNSNLMHNFYLFIIILYHDQGLLFKYIDTFVFSLLFFLVITVTLDFYSLKVIGGTCSAYGGEERRGVYSDLVGKPEGKRPLGRPRYRWEDNIKMALQELGCEVMNWIELVQDRDRWRALVNAVMNLRVA